MDRPTSPNNPTTGDTLALFRTLEASDRFRRDSALGGIFHHGKISFREVSATDSLHILIDGSSVSAHVDALSPLRIDPDGSARYSWAPVLAHNIAVVAADLGLRLIGRRGEQRCNLECEVVWQVDDELAELVAGPDHGEASKEGQRAPTTELAEVPFSLVDEAVHLLDSQAAPWSIQLEVRVAGHLDEARLRDAMTEAMARHPMARARKAPASGSQHRDDWCIPDGPDVDPLRTVECPDNGALDAARVELHRSPVPLTESPRLRARLARSGDGDVLLLNVNHAAMDCFALCVVQSVARAYAARPDPAPELDFAEERELPLRLGGRRRPQPRRARPHPGREAPGPGVPLPAPPPRRGGRPPVRRSLPRGARRPDRQLRAAGRRVVGLTPSAGRRVPQRVAHRPHQRRAEAGYPAGAERDADH